MEKSLEWHAEVGDCCAAGSWAAQWRVKNSMKRRRRPRRISIPSHQILHAASSSASPSSYLLEGSRFHLGRRPFRLPLFFIRDTKRN